MIIITKPGVPQSENWIGKCRNCSTEFTALTEDLVGYIEQGDYRTDGQRFANIDCPHCKHKFAACFHAESEMKKGKA